MTEKGIGQSIIRHAHTNITLIKAKGKILYKAPNEISQHNEFVKYKEHFKNLTIDELVDYVQKMPIKIRKLMEQAIKKNAEISSIGIKKQAGIGIGYLLHSYSMENNDLVSYIKARTAAAADARMSGEPEEVIAVAGSGNQGITSTIPIIAYSEKKGLDKELLLESITLSCLLTIYTTYHSYYLSAVCGCSTKSGLGASAGLAYYMSNRNINCCRISIQNFIANITGIICDGAKYECAFKLATTADAVFQSSISALYNKKIPVNNGILGKSAEESIKNMGRIVESTIPIDKSIITIMKEKM